MSRIPKIIHQTWKSRDLPENYKKYSNSWKNKHPEWEYKFYDDDDCIQFMSFYYPQFLNCYNSLEIPVMKADMFRYLVLYQFGGIYADIDAECLKSVDELLDDSLMIVGIDLDFSNFWMKFSPMYSFYKKHNINKQYVQYVFISQPKNHILLEIVDAICNYPTAKLDKNYFKNTFLKTGPGIFTKIVDKYVKKGDSIKVLNIKDFNGADNTILRYIMGQNSAKESYVKHHEAGSWKGSDDLIYILSSCLIIALLISILVFFVYGILYYFKCKKRRRGCLNKKIYCRIKKILIILSIITLIIVIIILINFAVSSRSLFWPF